MKKLMIPFVFLLLLVISACGNTNNNASSNNSNDSSNEGNASSSETITYEAETGPIEVPADSQRVVVLNSFVAGNVMALGTNIVGTDSWAMANPRYEEYLKNAVEVTDQDLEKIIELDPDLIIAASNTNNLEQLGEIAPTVAYTYGKVDYLTQHVEVGKLLNKEEEAQNWVDDFKTRAQEAGEEIRAKIGEDATVSVIENFDKELYVFGDNWGRGTEILYQEMKLKMPERVKEEALEAGYYTLSFEVLPEFAGDYVVFSKNSDGDTSFQETDTYKNIPAVKNGQVFEADAKEFYFNDPISLDFQLEFFKDSFLGN
ncbi:iron-hydroxamate ABC transporter substrate-binding protein [Bacillus sp. RO1]|uniref:iron-hydroxamate ABC transporter substrate-binding protein n=1 Tax=Bacillus sp. RO1 TaxID=2722703 RepID=UPI001456AE83|nr:iron-hydroxamate ABC transporter substrate-binding protein [Bacillus sp. RO1]NLP49720.1 iron-hydroxamate ABC transporter substrate-binding protein [Bacillus sp. RO1]